MQDVWVFIDESGNEDFSLKGTRFWTLTSLTLFDPTIGRDALLDLKRSLQSRGRDVSHFHASEDRQHIRDLVFGVLASMPPGQARIDTLIVDKRSVSEGEGAPTRFYAERVDRLLKALFGGMRYVVDTSDRVNVLLDRPSQRGATFQATLKSLKQSLPRHTQLPYQLYFHPAMADHGLQLADYASWAVFVRHERHELRPFGRIEHLVRTETLEGV